MNRDALLATLIGFGIGLVITGLLIIGPNLVKFFPAITFPKFSFSLPSGGKPIGTPTPQPETLAIDSPLPDAIESKDQLLLSGTAPKHSVVVISGFEGDVVITANGDGKYAGTVTLVEGKNDIVVTSYQDKKVLTQTVSVYYTPEEL